MKQLRTYFMSMLAVASLGIMTSCGDDNDTEPEEAPTIEFIGGGNFTSTDKIVAPGDQVTSKVVAKSGQTGTNLERFTITVSMNGATPTTAFDTTDLSGESFEKEFSFFTSGLSGSSEKWTYTIEDNRGRKTSTSYTITTSGSAGTGTVNTFSTELLGSYQNSNPGFYATTTGTRYFRNTAVNNQAAIDFVYFYGATNEATLAAPNDPDANSISDLKLNTWSTKNATVFKTTLLTAGAFDAITNSGDITTAYNSGTDTTPTSRANMLAVGDVIAFKTQAGKMGLIKVTALSAGAAGTLTIDVKVQK